MSICTFASGKREEYPWRQIYISFLYIGMILKGVDEIKIVIHLVIYWIYTSVGIVLGTVEKIPRAI